MLSVLKGIIIAFSMYSRIPVPRVNWEEKSMKYAMCFFPLVGGVVGALVYFWFQLCILLDINIIIRTTILVAIPVLISGGLHLDGLLDTIDALSSNKSKQEKVEILSDTHAGAFAIIFGILYFILAIGFTSQLSEISIVIVAIGYVLSRSMSAFSIVSFKMAKDTGLARTFSDMSAKIIVGITSSVYMIACFILMICYNVYIGISGVMAAILVFIYFRYRSYKSFGGITGDLCGYFLQLCELFIIIFVVGGEIIWF